MATRKEFSSSSSARQKRYFSEDFKKKKVKELDSNQTSMAEVCREYEVSRTAVFKWIYKYSAMRKKGIKQVVEAKSDTMKIKALKEKIRELEQLVGQKQVEIEFNKKMIEIAEEMYGIDIKKKHGSKPSSGSGSTVKNTELK